MRIYVQGLSALFCYRNGRIGTSVEQNPTSVRSLDGATSSRKAIFEERSLWRLGLGEPTVDRPLEVLVPNMSMRSGSRAIHVRVWKDALPLTAFREVSKSIYVSSPEFVFLQMATRLEMSELAALGMELCGTYRRNVEVGSLEAGQTSYKTEYHQLPLSTPRRLKGFLDSMPHAPGCVKARQALRYVLANSASPMETALALLLCLPRRLGGYALPLPVLNPPITFTRAGKLYTLRNSAKPDLLWRNKKLDLEYNSDEFHDESSRTKDSMRRKALEAMKYEVVELTHDELFSAQLLHATALRIAKKLGKQIRPETEGNFAARRAGLRERLLFNDATAPTVEKEGNSVQPSRAPDWDLPETGGPLYESDAIGIDFTDTWVDELPDFVEDWDGPDGDWAVNQADDWTIGDPEVDWDDIRTFGASGTQP